MIWDSWTAFFDMGGRGYYVWMSFGFTALVLAAEGLLLRQRRASAEAANDRAEEQGDDR